MHEKLDIQEVKIIPRKKSKDRNSYDALHLSWNSECQLLWHLQNSLYTTQQIRKNNEIPFAVAVMVSAKDSSSAS